MIQFNFEKSDFGRDIMKKRMLALLLVIALLIPSLPVQPISISTANNEQQPRRKKSRRGYSFQIPV